MSTVETEGGTLISAVYVSCADKAMTGTELTELMVASRKNNEMRGITGMLLYRGGNFMQVIEGPAASVEALLKCLKKDKRHTYMTLLRKAAIPERQFSQWQMAFRDISLTDMKTLEGYSSFMEWSFTSHGFQAEPYLSYQLLLKFRELRP